MASIATVGVVVLVAVVRREVGGVLTLEHFHKFISGAIIHHCMRKVTDHNSVVPPSLHK